MNKSKKWTVKHEPRRMYDRDLYRSFHQVNKIVLSDFNQDYYGEVNSAVRFFVTKIPVKKLGIIIRDPKDIFLSCMNRVNSSRTQAWAIHGAYTQFLNLPSDVCFIDFKKMVSNKNYLKIVFGRFDIFDVNIDKIDLNKKINENRGTRFETFDDLPKNMIKDFYKISKRDEFMTWDKLMDKLYQRCKESF